MSANHLTLALTGSGGAGVAVTGEMLLKAAAHAGFYGILRKSYGPQIRGGESAAILRLGPESVQSFLPNIQMVVALDWNNFSRFDDEIPIDRQTLVICEQGLKDRPEQVQKAEQFVEIPFAKIAKAEGSSRSNMAALGFIGQLLGLPETSLIKAMSERLRSKGDAVLDSAKASISAGYHYRIESKMTLQALPGAEKETKKRWLLSGNQAIAYGALYGGIRFAAAYPITPASDVMEWLAKPIESVGGHLIQAEDELAAINMIIGASFGGVPSLTATSGPGLSLMAESLGLAAISETPVVVIDVMRVGPSTGIPTKSEQGDLNLAVYGMHGDVSHIVLAPLDIQDCVFAGQWATSLAETLQTLIIVLSDQFLGQSQAIIDKPGLEPMDCKRLTSETQADSPYLRYLNTENGISPMALPGQPQQMYTAEGLEHNPRGTPSPKACDHQTQLDKRARKLEKFDFGENWGRVSGEGEIAIVCWGSLSAAATEAQTMLDADGIAIKLVCLRLIKPLPVNSLQQHLKTCKRIVIVEQNHAAQLYHLVKSQLTAGLPLESFAVPGPNPVNAFDIVSLIKGESS